MSRDPHQPLIAGVAAVQQRARDVTHSRDALQLMHDAVLAAVRDTGSAAVFEDIDVLMVPQGTWVGPDPARAILPDHPHVRTVVAEIGVLQQTLIGRACRLVAAEEARVVVICGGEAKFRSQQAAIAGSVAAENAAASVAPADGAVERMVPAHEVITQEEIHRGLPVPARQYALIDTAMRHAAGWDARRHIDELAALQARSSAIAAANPSAWNRTAVTADQVTQAAMLAWPYTKLHCSQWNVDQAAAIVVCSASSADRLGIAAAHRVHAHLCVESNLMVPVTLRADVDRSPAVAIVGEAIRSTLGCAPNDIEHLDLYSCFPAAVRMQVQELAIDAARPLSVTGGMTFGGGPLNNATLQALVKMVEVLRAHPGERGLVTNISGMLTKFGGSVWSTAEPPEPWHDVDVTELATERTATVELDPDHVGAATVVSYTVAHERGAPALGIVLADTPAGTRALATTSDPAILADMETSEWCGRIVRVDGASLLG